MQTSVVLPPGSQPAGAVPTMANVVIMPQYVPVPPQSAILTNYSSRSSLILGATQITIGILCILFNAVLIGTHSPTATVGHGIWGGIFFILTGSFGIVAAKQRTTCPIITFMVLSILSVVIFAMAILIMSSIGMAVENSRNIHLMERPPRSSRRAMDAIMLTLSLVEAIVAIWSSALCCSAMCCGRSSGGFVMQAVPATQTMGGAQVLYTAAYPQGGNVIQQQGMQQQQFTVAPMTQVAQPTIAYPPQYTTNPAPPPYVQTAPYGVACGGEPSAPAAEPRKVAL